MLDEQQIIDFIYAVLEAKFDGLNDREIDNLIKTALIYINEYPHLAQKAKDRAINKRKTYEMYKKYENRQICAICGGKCCKNTGCDFLTTDIPSLKEEDIIKLLKTNHVSIAADIALNSHERDYKVILTLTARNSHRKTINLISINTPCASLGSNGCKLNFKNRPGEGRHLIPDKYYRCNSDLDLEQEISKWLIYQDILKRLIIKYTNRSLEEELSLEMEEFFYDILCGNFYNATPEAKISAIWQSEQFILFFQDEYQRAENRYLTKRNDLRLINKRKM